MTQAYGSTNCGFTHAGLTCILPTGHPGDHHGRFSATPTAEAHDDSVLFALFGRLVSGHLKADNFYELGEKLPIFPVHLLDRALAVVRVSETWMQEDWIDLLREMNSSCYLPAVVHDFRQATKEAGDDQSGEAYYLARFAVCLIVAGYMAGRWDEGAAR